MHISIRALANACSNGLYPTTATRIAAQVLAERFDDLNYTMTERDGAMIDEAMAAVLLRGPESPDSDYCALYGATAEGIIAERWDELRASASATERLLRLCNVQPVDA